MEENRTLLIVDDEEETLKGYAAFLTPQEIVVARKSTRRLFGTGPGNSSMSGGVNGVNEKYNILLAQSGEEALRLFQDQLKQGKRIAAGFFDVKLGSGMDGLATIHAIKAMDKEIHCVVVTAYQDRSVEEINQIFGPEFQDQWDYLNKPFTQGEIVQKARQMVAAWNRKRQIESLTEQLIASDRLASIGQVARGIGHEFSNILQRMMSKIELSMIEKDSTKVNEHLKVMMKAVERAGVIVRNLQSFTKAQPQLRVGSIVEPIEEAISLVGHELQKNSIVVEKKLEESLPQLKLDAGAMAQVFLNLLINSIHAMPAGGKITFSATPAIGESTGTPGVLVRVQDTGGGIPEAALPRIFEFAFSTKGDKGSGLGLSISKDIVEAHAGKITVKTQEGQGTEFSIWLPLKM